MNTLNRTFVATFPAAVPGKVILAAYAQIDDRWYCEPRALDAASYDSPPSREALTADITTAVALGMFGSAGCWARVAGPSLTLPKFLFS
jgi:hypothetical protein